MTRREPSRAPALTDVARLAGVSHQTVSRVLNGHPAVREQTRLRVRAAIAELGYRPNTAARALARGSSRTIGVIAQRSTLFGPASTLAGLQEAASEADFDLTITSLATLDRSTVASAAENHLSQQVAGIIVIAPVESANDAIDALPKDLPVVTVDGDPNRPAGLVTIDQAGGAGLAVRHLLAAGHQSVWHIAGPDGWFDSAGREQGWRAALAAGGAEIPPTMKGDWSPVAGYHAGQTLARIPDVTAVFAANDQLALGAMKAFREAGRSVPGDISLVGFDDIVEAAYFSPPLTTIRPDFGELGQRALAALVHQIDHGESPEPPASLLPALVQRDSVSAPRS